MLNKVQIIGRLGQNPEVSTVSNGQTMVKLSVATDESYKDSEGNKVDKVEWHKVVVFGRPADFAADYLGKGRLVFVEGKLQTRQWQDDQGQNRYTTEIVARRLQALDRPKDDAAQQSQQQPQDNSHPPAQTQQGRQQSPPRQNNAPQQQRNGRTQQQRGQQSRNGNNGQQQQYDPSYPSGGMPPEYGMDYARSGMDDVPF